MRDGYGFIWTVVSILHLNSKSSWSLVNVIWLRVPPKNAHSHRVAESQLSSSCKNLDCTISGMLNDIRRSKDYQAHGIG